MMKEIIAYSESPKTALEALELAKQLARETNARPVVAHLGKLSGEDTGIYGKMGAEKIYHVDIPDNARADPSSLSTALAEVAKRADAEIIVIAGTRLGLETAPRLAQKLSTGYAAECVNVKVEEGKVIVQRGVLGGTYIAELMLKKKPYIVSIQLGKYPPSPSEEKTPEVEKIDVSVSPKLELIEIQRSEATGVELEKAELIVSVGRGFRKKEDLAIAEELARVIGAEIGCSRPIAGDLKWLPEERHIGLSGKRVRPKLYLAIGISGQVQHLVGMRDSKTVIAINTDPNAPIMQEADYAVVGDLYKIVPLLTEKLKQTLGK